MENTNSNPEEAKSAPAPAPAAAAPAATPAPAPAAPAPTGELPKTTGTTVGGWNRFAGYKPGDNNKKKNDRRDQRGRR